MIPKTASAVAAPSPETKPASFPSKTARRMHMTPTGPTGTSMTIPTTMPFTKNTKSIRTDPRAAARGQSPERGGSAQPEIRPVQEPIGRAMLVAKLTELVDDRHRGCVSLRIYVDRRRQAGDGRLAGSAGARGQHRFLLRVYAAIQRSSGAVAALPRPRARRARRAVERF